MSQCSMKFLRQQKPMDFKFNLTDFCKKFNINIDKMISEIESNRMKELILSGGIPCEFFGYANRDPKDKIRICTVDPRYVAGFIKSIAIIDGNSGKELDITFIPYSPLILFDWKIKNIHPRVIKAGDKENIRLISFDIEFNHLSAKNKNSVFSDCDE